MSDGSPFRAKIDALERELQSTQQTIGKKQTIPTGMIIAAVITPVVIFAGLYFAKPGIVMSSSASNDTEDDDGVEVLDAGDTAAAVRSKPKLILWTVVLTTVVYGGMYGYHRYQNQK
jgi:hypothetical protein